MMKKTTFAALAAAVVLTFNSAVSFANPASHHRDDDNRAYLFTRMEQMNDSQRSEMTDWKMKNLALQKKIMTKQVEWNWITPEQAKRKIERTTEWTNNTPTENRQRLQDHMKNNPKSKEDRPMRDGSHQQRMNLQASLTAEQKAEVQQWRKEKAELRKELVSKQLAWGWITKDQADYQLKRIDEWGNNPNLGPSPMRGKHKSYDMKSPHQGQRNDSTSRLNWDDGELYVEHS